ncbi:MAG: hypothetical protein M0Q26_13950 [Chitinophagaceae bacterium]|nr:hypothetical protein [Chitinophagaceae bacterium]MDP1763452.1 hypothetical protein [Sediminibacterium sp.]
MQTEPIKTECSIEQDLAQPDFCRILKSVGLFDKTPYQYRIGADFCIPFTNAFDTEGVYTQMDNNAIATCGIEIIPAYRVSDLEKCLEGFIIRKAEGYYQATLVFRNRKLTAFAERLPDVLASLLFIIIQRYPDSLTEFNKRILKSE